MPLPVVAAGSVTGDGCCIGGVGKAGEGEGGCECCLDQPPTGPTVGWAAAAAAAASSLLCIRGLCHSPRPPARPSVPVGKGPPGVLAGKVAACWPLCITGGTGTNVEPRQALKRDRIAASNGPTLLLLLLPCPSAAPSCVSNPNSSMGEAGVVGCSTCKASSRAVCVVGMGVSHRARAAHSCPHACPFTAAAPWAMTASSSALRGLRASHAALLAPAPAPSDAPPTPGPSRVHSPSSTSCSLSVYTSPTAW